VNQFLDVSSLPRLDWWLAGYRKRLPEPLYTPEATPPPALPKGVNNWLIHQTGDHGNGSAVGVVSHYVDTDRWNGTKEELLAYFGLGEETPPEPEPPNITFDVKKDIETLLFTGGTTGVSKGCMLTHRNIYANAIQNSWGLGKASTILCDGAIAVIMALPAFHSYGHSLIHSLHLIGLDMIVISDPRDTKAMATMIKKYHPVLQIGVPTQFMKLATEELKGVSIIGISGSAPLPSSAQSELDKKAVVLWRDMVCQRCPLLPILIPHYYIDYLVVKR